MVKVKDKDKVSRGQLKDKVENFVKVKVKVKMKEEYKDKVKNLVKVKVKTWPRLSLRSR